MAIDKVSLSGESLGGWVAGAFAVAHPDRVDRLVLNTAGADKVKPDALAALRAYDPGLGRRPELGEGAQAPGMAHVRSRRRP